MPNRRLTYQDIEDMMGRVPKTISPGTGALIDMALRGELGALSTIQDMVDLANGFHELATHVTKLPTTEHVKVLKLNQEDIHESNEETTGQDTGAGEGDAQGGPDIPGQSDENDAGGQAGPDPS